MDKLPIEIYRNLIAPNLPFVDLYRLRNEPRWISAYNNYLCTTKESDKKRSREIFLVAVSNKDENLVWCMLHRHLIPVNLYTLVTLFHAEMWKAFSFCVTESYDYHEYHSVSLLQRFLCSAKDYSLTKAEIVQKIPSCHLDEMIRITTSQKCLDILVDRLTLDLFDPRTYSILRSKVKSKVQCEHQIAKLDNLRKIYDQNKEINGLMFDVD